MIWLADIRVEVMDEKMGREVSVVVRALARNNTDPVYDTPFGPHRRDGPDLDDVTYELQDFPDLLSVKAGVAALAEAKKQLEAPTTTWVRIET